MPPAPRRPRSKPAHVEHAVVSRARLPLTTDALMHVAMFLGPKEICMSVAVSFFWHYIVTSNEVWRSIVNRSDLATAVDRVNDNKTSRARFYTAWVNSQEWFPIPKSLVLFHEWLYPQRTINFIESGRRHWKFPYLTASTNHQEITHRMDCVQMVAWYRGMLFTVNAHYNQRQHMDFPRVARFGYGTKRQRIADPIDPTFADEVTGKELLARLPSSRSYGHNHGVRFQIFAWDGCLYVCGSSLDDIDKRIIRISKLVNSVQTWEMSWCGEADLHGSHLMFQNSGDSKLRGFDPIDIPDSLKAFGFNKIQLFTGGAPHEWFMVCPAKDNHPETLLRIVCGLVSLRSDFDPNAKRTLVAFRVTKHYHASTNLCPVSYQLFSDSEDTTGPTHRPVFTPNKRALFIATRNATAGQKFSQMLGFHIADIDNHLTRELPPMCSAHDVNVGKSCGFGNDCIPCNITLE